MMTGILIPTAARRCCKPRPVRLRSPVACGMILLALFAIPAVSLAAASPAFALALREMLSEGQHPYLSRADITAQRDVLQGLYAATDFEALWSRGSTPTRQATDLLEALRAAAVRGLSPADYEANDITYHLIDLITTSAPAPTQWAQFDLALSVTAIRFLHDLHFGRVAPSTAGNHLEVSPDRLDVGRTLGRLATAQRIETILEGVEPPFDHYRLLRSALARYRALAQEPDLHRLPSLPRRSVKPGESYAGAVALRRLLIALGDMPAQFAAARTDSLLDAELGAAIERFQSRHGLAVDGTIGKRTFAELTRPLSARVRQIELTLERWRWLPQLEAPPIIVNIPQYRLFAFHTTQDHEQEMLQMDVIVGQSFARTRTPIFTAQMQYVVFRPYWDVPYSITTREMLPEIRANPGYLEPRHLEIVRGGDNDGRPVAPTPANIDALASGELRLRQQPGADNSLGLVKFMLPNAFNVYLHATPARRLFSESRRAFSHGCIRVADPVSLAEYVLRNQPEPWSRERIEAAMKSGPDSQHVRLAEPIRVFVLYGTAIATEAGNVLFFEDVYGHDRRLEALLNLPPAG